MISSKSHRRLARVFVLFFCGWSSYQIDRRLLSGDLFGFDNLLLRKQQQILHPRPKRLNGTLYLCGWESGRIAQHLFDDFLPDNGIPIHDAQVAEFRHNESHTTTPADILVFGGGDCGPGIHLQWLREHFRGTILYVNGESYAWEGSTAEHSYMISSQPTSLENTYVPYAAMALVGMVPPHIWPNLTSPTRPRNTGEFFMVYATRNCVQYRNQVALALSHVGMIHHGDCKPRGQANNNFTKLAPAHQGHSQWPNNYRLFSRYRFCLVLENGNHPGYVTEKLMYAFLGGCLPIWYGTTDVWTMFHKKSFLYVNVTDPESTDQLVRHVQYLEGNQSAYNEYFQHSILASDNVLEQYFSLDDDIGNGRLKHEIRVMMGLENRRYQQLPVIVSKQIPPVQDETVQPEVQAVAPTQDESVPTQPVQQEPRQEPNQKEPSQPDSIQNEPGQQGLSDPTTVPPSNASRPQPSTQSNDIKRFGLSEFIEQERQRHKGKALRLAVNHTSQRSKRRRKQPATLTNQTNQSSSVDPPDSIQSERNATASYNVTKKRSRHQQSVQRRGPVRLATNRTAPRAKVVPPKPSPSQQNSTTNSSQRQPARMGPLKPAGNHTAPRSKVIQPLLRNNSTKQSNLTQRLQPMSEPAKNQTDFVASSRL